VGLALGRNRVGLFVVPGCQREPADEVSRLEAAEAAATARLSTDRECCATQRSTEEPVILSPDELIEITGKSRPKAQAAVLAALGIPAKSRPDGSLVVLRVAAQVALGHHEATAPREQRPQLRFPPPRHATAQD